VAPRGSGYIGAVTSRARRQADYRPVREDWIWHAALPFIAYVTLLSGAIALVKYTSEALFAVAATSLLLLFIGIHNAWDAVTYVAAEDDRKEAASDAGINRICDVEDKAPCTSRS
jgi:hypothetical protein